MRSWRFWFFVYVLCFVFALVLFALAPARAGDTRDEARDCRRQVADQRKRTYAPPPPFPSKGTKEEQVRAALRLLHLWNERERDADMMWTITHCRQGT